MNVLILIDSLSVGGSEKKSVKIANELARRGVNTSIAYLCRPDDLLAQIDDNVWVTCLDRMGKFSIRALRNLRRSVADREISVILCINQYPLLYATLLNFLFFAGSIRIFLAVNTTEFVRVRDRIWMRIYSPLIKRIEAIIYGCIFQKETWEGKYGLGNVESYVFYNGVDTERFSLCSVLSDCRREYAVPGDFVVGCVGRLDHDKDHDTLIRAVSRLSKDGRRICVLVVGDGPERSRLEILAVKLGIENLVKFLGQVDDVRELLAAMDVFVLPSVETFSNAALEAMAMSKPVVLCDKGGGAEMVTDGQDGFLIERNGVDSLVTILEKLRADPQLAQRTGVRARDTVVNRFDFNRMVDKYEAILRPA